MNATPSPFRRRPIRFLLKQLSIPAFSFLTRLEIHGEENFPPAGPLLVVFNHFSFIDPVAVVRAAPWPLEFVGGAVTPHAPRWTRIIPFLWGYHKLYRGTGATGALRAAEDILKKSGILGIAPEAGNWATVLRPPRPGTAYLAARTGARILPIGLDGLTEVFPSLFRGRTGARHNQRRETVWAICSDRLRTRTTPRPIRRNRPRDHASHRGTHPA
jgi:1-acyl-sn-glycerol-3-phosphate acyltransferase